MPVDLPELVVPDAAAWRSWLIEHPAEQAGVWLVLAKKGWTEPTSLKYDEALDEAICHGWIDGLIHARDERTYAQRFTPRRKASRWSKSNVERVERLIAAGRMAEPGLAEVERAKQDGRWETAYPGRATIEISPALAAALDAEPAARELFDRLDGTNRYAILFRLHNTKDARKPDVIDRLVAMLARGETIYPIAGKA